MLPTSLGPRPACDCESACALRRFRAAGLVGLALVALLGISGAGSSSATARPADSQPVRPKAATTESVSFPCAALDQAAAGGESGVDLVEGCLAAARCLLSVECAGPLSAELHGTRTGRPRLAVAVDRAGLHLDRAAVALEATAIKADARQKFAERVELLRAFAATFSALASDDGSDAAAARLTDACIGLSAFVDEPRLELVESVKLWQAVAYRRAGRPDRALRLLRPALGRLSFTRVDVLSRMLRCRILADRGMYPAALSLAQKLGKWTDVWPGDEGKQLAPRAAASLRLLRADIHRRWAQALRDDGQPQRAAAAERRAAEIIGADEKTLAPDRLLYLDEAIAGLSTWERPETQATTQRTTSQPAS